jgi:ketosteroid isomerase-like protein
MDAALRALVDRQAVVDTIVRYAQALDAKDWAAARACFADEVEAEYADLRGTGPERLTADAFVELRRRALEPLQTHHLSASHLVTLDGDRATCVSATLIHRRDPARARDATFDTLAHYTHGLARTPDGWRITRVRQIVAWNRQHHPPLVELAMPVRAVAAAGRAGDERHQLPLVGDDPSRPRGRTHLRHHVGHPRAQHVGPGAGGTIRRRGPLDQAADDDGGRHGLIAPGRGTTSAPS